MDAHDIDLLLRLVDQSIQAEIERICSTPVKPTVFSELLTPEGIVLARRMGIKL